MGLGNFEEENQSRSNRSSKPKPLIKRRLPRAACGQTANQLLRREQALRARHKTLQLSIQQGALLTLGLPRKG
ncbi:hypothetical protein GN958_ATG03657 [Phytophthora infestans]|uniref:Uncharacterized protein n=1 Tax=Phytophthora infestans TaxID=4787 RepID=A0A8S9V551_PHYIN|nr:hypothetical protein GN958_ATG03657 [Phytophthora infestans]